MKQLLPGLVLSVLLAGLAGLPAADAQDFQPMSNLIPAAMPTPLQQQAAEQFVAEHPTVGVLYEGDIIARVYGPAFGTGSDPIDTAQRFVTRHVGLFGVSASDLEPVSLLPDRRHTQPVMFDWQTGEYKFTLVYFSQYRDGLPVFRSELRLLVRHLPGYPLVLAVSTLRDIGDFTVDPILANMEFDPAVRTDTGMTRFWGVEKVIWAGLEGEVVAPVLAVTFIGDNGPDADPPEVWRYVCDATTGAILHQETMIHFNEVSGTVRGMATSGPKSDNCADEVATPLPYAQVNITGQGTVYANASGQYTIPASGSSVTVNSPMTGYYFYVDNVAGSEDNLSMTVSPPGFANFMHNQANSVEAVRAQTNGYLQANIVRDWCLVYNPSYPTIAGQINFPVYVNQTSGYCPGNAWYDGSSINFCSSSGSYPNTAYSSVVHHEYGHHMVASGGSGQGEYGEGMSDCVAALIANDPVLGYGFTGNCNTGIRTASNTCQYLASGCSTCGSAIHSCGQLLSGIVWDIRTNLMATNPSNYLDIISTLTVNSILLHTGTSINAQIAIDFLTLDDDDANQNNGTPHRAEICAGFSAHGLSCPALPALAIWLPAGPPSAIPAGVPTTLSVQITNGGENYVPGTGFLYYRYDGGAYTPLPLVPIGGTAYEVTLPAPNCSSTPQYYLSAQGSGGTVIKNPSNAPTTVFASAVGVLSLVMDDTLESDQGWTVGDTGDNATLGIWTRADPEPTIAQPGDDHTPAPGVKCWVTDYRAGSSAGSYDVDGGKTTVKTPTINLAGFSNATIGYWRWYSNDKGAAPGADVFVVDISNNNGATWVNAETVGPTGPGTTGGWIYHEFRVADFVTPTAQIKLRFVASDYGSGSLVEAAIDDFQVFSLECNDAPVCGTILGDLDGNGLVNGLDIQGFVDALLGTYHPCADFNGNQQAEPGDMDGMVNALLAP